MESLQDKIPCPKSGHVADCVDIINNLEACRAENKRLKEIVDEQNSIIERLGLDPCCYD